MIYIVLFALLMGGIVSSSYAFLESGDRNQTKAVLQEEKDFILGKINWALSGAQVIGTPGAGSSGSSLAIVKYDGTNVTVTQSGSNVALNGTVLNNSNVTISKLTFIHTYTGGTNPESIEAGFTISAKTPNGTNITQTASTTRYVRK